MLNSSLLQALGCLRRYSTASNNGDSCQGATVSQQPQIRIGWDWLLNCCWSSPAQSFLASGLVQTFDQDFFSVLDMYMFEKWGLLRVRVTLRVAVYRQSVRLGAKTLEAHNQSFFFQQPLRSECLCNILSDGKMGVSWICFAFIKHTYRTYSMLFKILPIIYTSPLSVCFAMPILRVLFSLCYNGSLVSLHRVRQNMTRVL
jgi:hypothetical protein